MNHCPYGMAAWQAAALLCHSACPSVLTFIPCCFSYCLPGNRSCQLSLPSILPNTLNILLCIKIVRRLASFITKCSLAFHSPSFSRGAAAMKVELCCFSRYEINSGHGKWFAGTHGKVFQFLITNNDAAFLSKKNSQQINWSVFYRGKYKTGQLEYIQENLPCSLILEGHTGASLAAVIVKRNQRPGVAKAQ